MSTNFDRRNFLKLSSGAGAGMALHSFAAVGGQPAKALLGKPVPAYSDWKDVYRKQWTWDKVVRGTHIVNCWYQAHCAWDVYVKDGLVFREEQAAEYEKVNDELPDYNPRGCNKGGCYSERMYDPTRVTHPLKRVGERGHNQWERVTWDAALTDIADTWLDVATKEGTDRVIWEIGPAYDVAMITGAFMRFSGLTQSVMLDQNSEIGDGHRGAFETFGKIFLESSADDYFYSDLILFWAGNPIYTQIPQAHFFTEAKYRGAKIISICPDFNASATKADLWIPIKPGTDGALAMGVVHLLIKEGKVNADFVREQTDLVMLVRDDTQTFLTEADLKAGGKADQFFVVDEKTGQVAAAPWRTLDLAGLTPALDSKATVTLRDGKKVAVRTVYNKLIERAAEYTPDAVAKTCGIKPGLVRRLAKEIGAAKRMRNITQSTHSKLYHGNLMTRAQILMFALTGNIGRKGANFGAFPVLTNEGIDTFVFARNRKELEHLPPEFEKLVQQRMEAGQTLEMAIIEIGNILFRPGATPFPLPIWCSGTIFWQVHAGVKELTDKSPDWGRNLRRSVDAHLEETVQKGWQPCVPKIGDDPRIMFSIMSNPFRRIRGSQKLEEVLLPKLAKYVVLDWRMNSSTRFADYVLPVSAWYERTTFKWVTPLSPYLTITNAATPPMGESKSDWEVMYLLAKKIQERAKARGITLVKSPQGMDVDFGTLYDRMTIDGEFTENDLDKACKYMFEKGKIFGDVTWEQAKEKGFARYTRVPNDVASIGIQSDIPKNDSLVALKNHVEKKVPYPTTTRRIQFYLDHELYHEYDEALPRHKDAPTIGGDYPLVLSGGKTRWSIHAAWRDSRVMMRLHRPEAYVLLSPSDAAARGIKEMDWIRVRNDISSFEARAGISPQLQPGQTMIYNAWEKHQFRGKGDMNSVNPSPMNPVEMAGGDGTHLKPWQANGQPSMFDRETRVEIERVGEAA